jgi:uncharacterized alpha-E superfamily protein
MLSRVADSLYWINRYVERAENISRFVEVSEALHRLVGDVTRDLLRSELRVAGIDFVLFDVNRRERVVLDEVLAENDRVLEVVAFP